MKKRILITACSMDIGGVERSLAGLLNAFDYDKYDVDLLLFSKKGEFLSLLPPQCNLLPEIAQLATLLKPVKEVVASGHILLAAIRVFSKAKFGLRSPDKTGQEQKEEGSALLQAYWDNSVALIPQLDNEYDAAISFMWPHHYVAKKVRARMKIAWIHTDFTRIEANKARDKSIWEKFNKIAAVSDECRKVFLSVYPSLNNKVVTIENILNAEFIRRQADEFIPEDIKDNGDIKLLSIGRFCHAKAFDFAADVCRLLIDREIYLKWYIIGFGNDEEYIRDKIKTLSLEGIFIILGKRNNPYPYIKACDIYIQPSRYEGKAVTVREAQILGKPVVITNFKTAASQVRSGFDGIISPMDKESVSNCIVRLMNDDNLRNTLTKNLSASDFSNTNQPERIYRLIEGKEV